MKIWSLPSSLHPYPIWCCVASLLLQHRLAEHSSPALARALVFVCVRVSYYVSEQSFLHAVFTVCLSVRELRVWSIPEFEVHVSVCQLPSRFAKHLQLILTALHLPSILSLSSTLLCNTWQVTAMRAKGANFLVDLLFSKQLRSNLLHSL